MSWYVDRSGRYFCHTRAVAEAHPAQMAVDAVLEMAAFDSTQHASGSTLKLPYASEGGDSPVPVGRLAASHRHHSRPHSLSVPIPESQAFPISVGDNTSSPFSLTSSAGAFENAGSANATPFLAAEEDAPASPSAGNVPGIPPPGATFNAVFNSVRVMSPGSFVSAEVTYSFVV